MEINTDIAIRCLKPIGRLDTVTSLELDKALDALPGEATDIILDLSQCPYLSSAGIRILLKWKKRLQAAGSEFYIAGIVPEVYRVLEMAGLQQILRFKPSVESCLADIRAVRPETATATEFEAAGSHWVWKPSGGISAEGMQCAAPEVLSYAELGFSVGFGTLSESGQTGGSPDLFAVLGTCCGFVPSDPAHDPDVRIVSDPVRSGIPVREAFSFGHTAAGTLTVQPGQHIRIAQVAAALDALKAGVVKDHPHILIVAATPDEPEPSISIFLALDPSLIRVASDKGMEHLPKPDMVLPGGRGFTGITFRLASLVLPPAERLPLEGILPQLQYENILSAGKPDPMTEWENPVIWVFTATRFAGVSNRLLRIETPAGQPFEPHQAFLARRLYTDSSRLVIHPLHGGFSAQTFQVESFDHEGRKMRPTVLKVGSRNLVTREAERCKTYALPYIFNNSAVVLGAEFHGDTGALRYNFVGIGGESTQLKWLTHYYLTSGIDFLSPLFDKVFLHILKPWYGQPVSKTIFPFRDHDPTFTFFPHIYKTVSDLFSVSADDPVAVLQENGQTELNPFWYLKYEYARRRDWAIDYFTGICHGDLNMQNILLDESMNVYLIDFSETRPRSVVSDFARLEAIFMVDNAPLDDAQDMEDYVEFIRQFYATDRLDTIPEINYRGKHRERVEKNAALTLKMRRYAFDSTRGNPDAIPYFIALLEWVLPIVCYFSLPVMPRRLSMIVSSILCTRLAGAEKAAIPGSV